MGITKNCANMLFIWACLGGWLEGVKMLVETYTVDPSFHKNCGVAIAAELNHKDILLYLLDDSRVDPTVFDHCVACWCAHWGQHEIVRRLVPDALSLEQKHVNLSLCLHAELGNLRLLYYES